MTLEQTIAAMLTENTGTHMLDSGGAYGRNWQRNAGASLDDWRARPSATLEIYMREYNGKLTADLSPCVDIFHLLTGGALELDEFCREFNKLPVDDWKGDFYGVSIRGAEWLENRGFVAHGDGFNTYNWASNHSQVMQGQELARESEWGEENYILLQIHGGCDVRGGYTDAKLFKLAQHAELYNVLTEDCGFTTWRPDVKDELTGETKDDFISLSWHGEWINQDGQCASDDDLLQFAVACGASLDNSSVTIHGDAYLDF